jgi:hypothetical protein
MKRAASLIEKLDSDQKTELKSLLADIANSQETFWDNLRAFENAAAGAGITVDLDGTSDFIDYTDVTDEQLEEILKAYIEESEEEKEE